MENSKREVFLEGEGSRLDGGIYGLLSFVCRSHFSHHLLLLPNIGQPTQEALRGNVQSRNALQSWRGGSSRSPGHGGGESHQVVKSRINGEQVSCLFSVF